MPTVKAILILMLLVTPAFAGGNQTIEPRRNIVQSLVRLLKKEHCAKEPKLVLVRTTVYWRFGKGADRWTANGQSATGVKLRQGHCAVDPRTIPYGSRIILPNGKTLTAVDTGGAVKRRTAAIKNGKNVPVVDVYFDHKSDAMRYAKSTPMFQAVYILPSNA